MTLPVAKEGPIDVSIITVNWNVRELVKAMIESIPAAVGPLRFEVIVVDNASKDGSVDMLRAEFPEVTTIASPDNLGFARGNNLGFERSKGDVVAFVNPDMVLAPGSILGLVEFLRARPKVGMVGPKIVLPDGFVQSEVKELPGPRTVLLALPGGSRVNAAIGKASGPSDPNEAQRSGYLHGSCFALPRRAYEQIGLMPVLTFMYGEEVMMGHLLREHGYEVWYFPKVSVTHFDDASANKRWQPREKKVLKRTAHTVVMRRVLPAPLYFAWNSLMVSREAARDVMARVQGEDHRLHEDMLKVHLAAFAERGS